MDRPATRPPRVNRMLTYFGVAAVIGAVGAVLIRFFGASPPLAVGVYALVLIGVMIASFWWWRGVDEAVREAHKASWFWGGLFGVMVGAPLLFAAGYLGDETLIRWSVGSDPHDLVVTGVLACLLVQLVGYTVAWAIWWLKRR